MNDPKDIQGILLGHFRIFIRKIYFSISSVPSPLILFYFLGDAGMLKFSENLGNSEIVEKFTKFDEILIKFCRNFENL